MSFTELVDNMKERSKNRKELIRDLDERARIEDLVANMRKSSNQRELEGYLKEINEEKIKSQLDQLRKIRDHDIKFNHNPLNVKNITNHTDFEVLKQRNLFNKKSDMFSNNHSVLMNNLNLLKNNMRLLR